MSERLNKLPPDIAEIEAGLAQLPLPANSINRDELLYRAGWAAAEVKFSHQHRCSVSHWLWPATSAALAATVLFLLFAPQTVTTKNSAPRFAEGLPKKHQSNQFAHIKTINSESGSGIADQGVTPPQRPAYDSQRRPQNTLRQNRGLWWDDSPRSLLAMRYRTWMRQFDRPRMEMVFDDSPSPPSKTSRELLHELLPELEQSTENDAQQKENHWNWPKQLWEALS